MQKTTTPERVTRVMEALGYNQVELAKKAGASKSMVNQWLSGLIKTIGPRYAFNLERTTGFRAEWLMTGTGAERTATQPDPGSYPEYELGDKLRTLKDSLTPLVEKAAADYKAAESDRIHTAWPFSAALLDRVNSLSEYQRGIIEGRLRSAIEELERDATDGTKLSANGKR